jgi:2-polyprenyl-3-methyl-5-hydroxy-6-metoxy-1,4-benzoquinol methylase
MLSWTFGQLKSSAFRLDAWRQIREKGGHNVKHKTQASSGSSDPGDMEILPTQAGYDRWAEFYDGEDNPLVLLEERHLAPLAGDVAGLAVADIGCGTGRHALRLAAAGARVTAVDFSEAMLQRAHGKPGADAITFVCHDLAKPSPLESGAFDRVFCCLVLDHIAELDKFFSRLTLDSFATNGQVTGPGIYVDANAPVPEGPSDQEVSSTRRRGLWRIVGGSKL